MCPDDLPVPADDEDGERDFHEPSTEWADDVDGGLVSPLYTHLESSETLVAVVEAEDEDDEWIVSDEYALLNGRDRYNDLPEKPRELPDDRD